jgi:hypothetical protein
MTRRRSGLARAAPDYSSWPGGQRQLYTIAGSNGHVGYTIDLIEAVDGGVP